MLGNYGKLNKTWIISLEQRNIMMTWHDSWQYVITWHTSHDVKAWLHKHKIWHLTSSICRCEWTGAMILLLFRTVFRSRNTFLTIADWVTFTHAFTRDLETEGHVMVYVTFVISACICPTAMIFLLFRKDFRSGNSFQLSPFAWPSRLTLKLNVTWRDICLRDICHFCLYLCYRNDFFCLRKVFGSGNSF